MNVLFISLGSYGDILPMVSIGKEFLAQNHQVTLMTNENFKEIAISHGFAFLEVGTQKEYISTLKSINVKDSIFLGAKLLDFLVLNPIDPMLKKLQKTNKKDLLIISYPGNIAAKIFAEKHNINFVSVVFAPILLKSITNPPRINSYDFLNSLPIFIRRFLFFSFESILNLLLLKKVNKLRKSIGLDKISDFTSWIYSEQLILALFDESFCAYLNDWPKQVQITGFPLASLNSTKSPTELREFFQSKKDVILFTQGTPNSHISDFFSIASKICKQLDIKGIFVTQFIEQIQNLQSDHIIICKSIDFKNTLAKIQGIVHHGGIGTSAQSLQAGIPQIIIPWGVDQYDNAKHLKKMGVSIEVSQGKSMQKNLQKALKNILSNQDIQAKAKKHSKQRNAFLGHKRAYEILIKHFT
ncbi:MAG: hypothetical protein COB02_08955 [Candidatus Cloacimonadota bacterium]|nr:MAG: hypothetical protein COB02_08955 [Candidatus Cloacimonadota bacterium]